jgi:penicillin-binding protein 2
MGLDFGQERTGEFQQRLVVCLVAIVAFFFLVFARLFYLQVVRGNYFWVFSAEHTMKEIRTPATRGVIYDRNRIPIAENRPSFDLALVPQHVRDIEKVKRGLFETAGIDPAIVEAKWKGIRNQPAFFPLVILSDIPYDQAVRIRAAQSVEGEAPDPVDFQGVEILAKPLRSYPNGAIAAAALGYIGEISGKELQRFQKEEPGRYLLGDLVGAAGLERYWERFLRGKDGHRQKIVDAVGREIVSDEFESFLRKEEAVHGNNLILTLDSRLQKFAEERFGGKSGALVAIDPRDGGILAIVSLPSYDPGALVSNVSHDAWSRLVSDPRNLLLNRAVQGTYPPGSTYKIVTSIAALEEGVIRPEEKLGCRGGLQFGDRFFKCWNKGGHGAISLHGAIASSCDTFFYQVGLRLGVDRLAKYARLLGFGQKTGIDLDGEKGGTIPTSEWKRKVFKQEWQAGENLSIAVGQGYNTVTPLQNALMAARVASGKAVRPHLIRAVEDEEGRILEEGKGEAEPLPVSEKTLELVRAGMADVVKPGGTAAGSRSPLVAIAGKTGTAQVISEEGKARARGINTQDHAWFIAYAPAEEPRIAVGVIVEHGGFGASAAAPIVRDVIEKYMELQGK